MPITKTERQREYESDKTEETYNQRDVNKQAKVNRTKKAIKWTFQEKKNQGW